MVAVERVRGGGVVGGSVPNVLAESDPPLPRHKDDCEGGGESADHGERVPMIVAEEVSLGDDP